jgi:hypothetical protein
MAVIEDTKTQWTIVDPSGLRHTPKVTETAGVVRGRPDNGYFTTSRAELAAELKEKYPHMLVTKHEAYAGDKRRRTVNFTMPLSLQEMHERWLKWQETQTTVTDTPKQETEPNG